MLTIQPQENIDKIKLILDDLFKLSRLIGTFPIDSDYSGISKYNLTKGMVIYVIVSTIIMVLSNCVTNDDVEQPEKVLYIFQIAPIVIFHLINLLWLVVNSHLIKEIYDELKDIEYQLSNIGLDQSYSLSWFVKYLGFAAMIVFGIVWEVFYKRWKHIEFRLPHHMTYPSLIAVMNQYLSLLQICYSMLKLIRMIEESDAVIKLTDKLLAVFQKLNSLYEPQLLAYISNIFLVILVMSYVKIIMGSSIYVGTVSWVIAYLTPLLMITLYSGYISQEVSRFNKYIGCPESSFR